MSGLRIRPRLLVALAGTILVLAGCQSKVFYLPETGAGTSDWKQAGGGPAGRSYVVQELLPPLQLLWQQNLDGMPVGGVIFSGHLALQLTTSPTLFAFDRRSGRLLGKRGIDEEVCAPPVLAGDLVFYGELGKKPILGAYDRHDLDRRWKREGGCSHFVVRGDTLVTASEAGDVLALNTGDGEELWELALDERLRTGPTLGAGLAFVGTGSGELVAVRLEDGVEQWRQQLDAGVRTRPLFVAGTVYAGSAAGTVYAFDAGSGAVRWLRPLGQLLTDGFAWSPGLLAVGSVDRNLYGLDPESGELAWSFATDGVLRGSPAATDGSIYCGSGDGHVYAIDPATGGMLWRFEVDGPVYAPVSIGERMIAIATESKSVYVFGRL